jgi:hypothetical protein
MSWSTAPGKTAGATTTNTGTSSTGSAFGSSTGSAFTSSFTSNWSGFNKRAEPEKALPPLSDDQLVRDVPEKLREEFRNIESRLDQLDTDRKAFYEDSDKPAAPDPHRSSPSTDPSTPAFPDRACKRSREVNRRVREVTTDLTNLLTGDLVSVAHETDQRWNLLNEFSAAYKFAKDCYDTADQIRFPPSRFVMDYVDQIERRDETLSQDIASYGSQLRPEGREECDDFTSIVQVLQAQHDAVLRTATRVSALKEKLSTVRENLLSKLTVSQVDELESETTVETACAAAVRASFDKFMDDKKADRRKRAKESDLFGRSTKEAAATKSPFGFGTSSFTANRTGSTLGSGLGINTTTNASVAPSATPPTPTPGKTSPFSMTNK